MRNFVSDWKRKILELIVMQSYIFYFKYYAFAKRNFHN